MQFHRFAVCELLLDVKGREATNAGVPLGALGFRCWGGTSLLTELAQSAPRFQTGGWVNLVRQKGE
jgi:hypothetical protein